MISFPKILLASASPRRHELLQKMDLDFEVHVPIAEEIIPPSYEPKKAPEYLARLKAQAAKSQFNTDRVIIASDTMVFREDKILGKPTSMEHARETIAYLSGQSHSVITGVCLLSAQQEMSFSCETVVQFKNISSKDIEYYISNYEVMDKAGSYGIQDWIGVTHIESIQGSYTNIMGLPTTMLYHKLIEFSKQVAS